MENVRASDRNVFQFGSASLVEMMKLQVGSEGRAPLAALSGHWGPDLSERFSFRITDINVSFGGKSEKSHIVAFGLCDDEKMIECTPSFFLRDDVVMQWKTTIEVAPGRDASDFRLNNAFGRAKAIGKEFAQKRKEAAALSSPDLLPPAVIVTLDGDGRNRRAFIAAFEEMSMPPPRIIAYERDAVVALCQRLCGYEIVLTGADQTIRSKKPLIEHLALSGRVPREAGLLYLDYCGGPPAGVDMGAVLASFPNLLVYASTISHRQHPDAADRFLRYVPMMYGFHESRTFLDNHRVVSKVFSVDKAAERHVSVPGCFWQNCPKSLKRKYFSGVLIDDETASVVTERGRETIFLAKKARVAYAVKRGQMA